MTTAPATLYSPVQLEQLAARHGIDTAAGQEAMAMQLERAGQHYLAMRSAEHLAAEDASFRAELMATADAAQQLAAALAALSPRAVAAFDVAATMAASRALLGAFPDRRAPAFAEGAAILPGPVPDSAQPIGWSAAWAAAAAAGIASNAHYGIRSAKRFAGNPTQRQSLLVWVENMRALWHDLLARPFTFDMHRGVGITRAFVFCAEALAIIDPHFPPKKLQTAMRQAIAAERDRRAPTI